MRLFLLSALLAAASVPPTPANPAVVGRAIAERRARVVEFGLIKQAAEELGVRVWLFGGTAAGYAHYVRWDLAREAGDPRYREGFFDYDFTNIYRSTQDADLVVDGTPEQAQALEGLIKERMSFLQGSKDHWEVRLLRQDRVAPGGQVKQALLANPDFLEQNTDSNSTGMIELTDPPPGERVVRDLRDWENPLPFFLQDVTSRRLHYYLSPTHQNTARFRQGDNPPLFSVIRYLVKAFQYDLAVDGEDLKEVRAIIEAFDPGRDYPGLSPWAQGWLERYGSNLIRHAVNVEYAWDTLEKLGLREKLISLSEPSRQGSLAWWLAREPLRTRPLGEGTGRTAAEIGVDLVAHETRDFLAYESMTRDVSGRPNVLISRPGQPGEHAISGPGFYTRRGRAGARGTGLTIRFRVDPAARAGSDFEIEEDYLRILNRAALQVIPESLNLSFPAYLAMLRDGGLASAERGVWMKLARRLSIKPLSVREEGEAVEIALRAADEKGALLPEAFLSEWLNHPIAGRHREVQDRFAQAVRRALRSQAQDELAPFLLCWFGNPVSREYPETLLPMAEQATAYLASFKALGVSTEESAARGHARSLLAGWFSLPVSTEHPELVRRLIDAGEYEFVARQVLEKRPEWADHPELLKKLLEEMGDPLSAVLYVLPRPQWASHGEILQYALDLPGHHADLALALLLRSAPVTLQGIPPWLDRPEIVHTLLDRASWESFQAEVGPAPGHPGARLEEWGKWKAPVVGKLADTLHQTRWGGEPALVRLLIEALPPTYHTSFEGTVKKVLNLLRAPQWAGHPELVLAWVRQSDPSWEGRLQELLGEGPWRNNPLLLQLCGGGPVEAGCLREAPEYGLAERIDHSLRELPGAQGECR